jgi:hypothetical protein
MVFIVLRHTESNEHDIVHGIFDNQDEALKYIDMFMTTEEQYGTTIVNLPTNIWLTSHQFRSHTNEPDTIRFREKLTEQVISELKDKQRKKSYRNQLRRERKPNYMVQYTDISDFMNAEPKPPVFVQEYSRQIASKNTWLLSQYNSELIRRNDNE